MANPVQSQELIDLDGLRKSIAATRAEYKEWVDESTKLNALLLKSSQDITSELERMRKTTQAGTDDRAQQALMVQSRELSKQLADQKAASFGLTTAQQANGQVVESLTSRLEKLVTEYANLDQGSARNRTRANQLAKEMVNVRGEMERLNKVTKANASATAEVVGSYNLMQRELADARRALKSLDDAFDSNTGKLNVNNAAAVALSRTITRADTALKQADATMGVHNRNIDNYKGAVSGAVLSLSRWALGLIGVNELLSQGRAFIDAEKRTESFRAAIDAVHSSSEQAAESQRFVYQQADVLGAELQSVSGAFITLAGSTRGSALEGENTRKIYNSIITAGVGMRRSNEEIQRAVTATGQVFSKQKVQAEELSGQLAEALPGSLQILAKELGVTTRQLLQMAQDGKLLAIEVLPALAKGLEKAYSKNVAENADNIASNTNRMTNAIQAFKTAVFEETGAKDWFNDLLKTEIAEVKDWIFFFKNFKELRGDLFSGNLAGDALTNKRKDTEMRNSTYDSFGTLSTAEMAKTINIQEEAQQTVEQRRHLRRLREIYKQRLVDEKNLSTETAKQKAELVAEQNAKTSKSRQTAANQALQNDLGTASAKTDSKLYSLDAEHEADLVSERDYIQKRYVITVAGINEEKALLEQAGKTKTDDYARRNADLLKAAAQRNKSLAKLEEDDNKERAKLEDDRWKKAVDATKDALKDIDAAIGGNLTQRLSDLESAYETEEGAIRVKLSKRLITEKRANEQIRDLRVRYLSDISNATQAAADSDIQLTEERINELKATARTEEELAQAVALEKDRLRKAEADKVAADAKFKKDTAKATTDTEIQEAERSAKARITAIQQQQEVTQKYFELAGAAIQGYFDVTSANRQQEIDNLDRQKEYEISLVGDNDAAKAEIEKRYAARQTELRRKQAIADKAAALFQIGLNTALAVSQINASALVNLDITQSLRATLTALVIGLGAIQAATVLAKPLPQFYIGTTDAPEGPAWVGERGYELIESKKGGKSSYRLAAEKQVAYLNKHDRVYTHEETKRVLGINQSIAREVRTAPGGSQYMPPVVVNAPGITKGDLLDAFRQQTIEQTTFEDGELKKYILKQNQKIEVLNKLKSLPKTKH